MASRRFLVSYIECSNHSGIKVDIIQSAECLYVAQKVLCSNQSILPSFLAVINRISCRLWLINNYYPSMLVIFGGYGSNERIGWAGLKR